MSSSLLHALSCRVSSFFFSIYLHAFVLFTMVTTTHNTLDGRSTRRIKQDVHAEEKDKTKKRRPLLIYALLDSFFSFKVSDGLWFYGATEGCHIMRQLSRFAVDLSPHELTFSAYTPLWRYIDQSNCSHLIQRMLSEVKCTFDSRLRSLFRFRNCLEASFNLAG